MEISGDSLPAKNKAAWLKRIREKRGVSQKSLSQDAAVKQSLISAAENEDRGLSVKSAERIGEELDACPVGLFIGSQVLATVKSVESGDSEAGEALSRLTKLRTKLARIYAEGDLPDTNEVDESAAMLFTAIDGLEEVMDEAGPSRSTKSRALDELDDVDPNADLGPEQTVYTSPSDHPGKVPSASP